MPDSQVAFIGGGQMALALAGGAIRGGVLDPSRLTFVEPNAAQRELLSERFPQSRLVETASGSVREADRIVLAVKPQVLKTIAGELQSSFAADPLWVSIAAGISLPQLHSMLDSQRVIRVMPNTPAQVGAGATAMSHPPTIATADVDWVRTLMSSVGTIVTVPDHLMHAVTAVSGSGPAYLYLVIEALSDGGVAIGLPRPIATQLAAQTVAGAAGMVLQTGQHPGQLKDQVTSPGGTTIAALRTLEAAGVRSAFIEAVARASQRSEELG